MNRTVVAIVALAVAAVLLATPPALGKLTEARVRERVAALDDSGVLTAEIKSYDRGWFLSNAKIELGLAPGYLAQLGTLDNAAAVLGRRTTIAIHFAHGPVALQNGVHIGWSAMVARLDPAIPGIPELERQLGVPYLFEFRGRTGITGALRFDADVPPMDVPAGAAQFKFSGAILEGRYTRGQLVAEAHVSSFEFSAPTGTFLLHNLLARMNNRILSRYVAPGEAELSIESIAATDPFRGGAPLFELEHLKITSDVALDAAGALLDLRAAYGLDRLHLVDDDLSDATVGLALHNLDVAMLEKYADVTSRLALSTAADAETTFATLAPHIQRALAAGPSLVLEPLSFKLDGEPFEGRIELSTNRARAPQGRAIDFDPLLLMELLNGSADLRLSKALARRFATAAAALQLGPDPGIPPDQLSYLAEAQSGLLLLALESQGVLVEDGDGYRVAVRYADGGLTVNGNLLPFGLP